VAVAPNGSLSLTTIMTCAIASGRGQACVEACRGNSVCIQDLFANDYGGRGGRTLICGAGLGEENLEDLPGGLLTVGRCAWDEVGAAARQRNAGRRIVENREHNDLLVSTRYQALPMGISPLSFVPLRPAWKLWLLTRRRLRGLKGPVPPPWG
jgi:hypothetical protein